MDETTRVFQPGTMPPSDPLHDLKKPIHILKCMSPFLTACRAPPDIDGLVKDLDLSFSTRQNRPPESDQARFWACFPLIGLSLGV